MKVKARAVAAWIAAGVAVAACCAVWQWWGAERAPAPPAPFAAEAPAGHLALPQSLPASSAPMPAGPLAQASAPATPTSEPAIDSQGFAPIVQRALDSGDPKQALEAAQWLARCSPDVDVESMLNGSHPKYRINVSPEVQRQWVDSERQTQRYCQTLTPDLMAHHKALALRALEGNVPGSGLAYYQSLDRENRTDSERDRALQGLRADAEQGTVLAVPVLAKSALGQTRAEQLAYQKLLDHLMLMNLLPPMAGGLTPVASADPPYTAKEQADATALVRRLLPRFQQKG